MTNAVVEPSVRDGSDKSNTAQKWQTANHQTSPTSSSSFSVGTETAVLRQNFHNNITPSSSVGGISPQAQQQAAAAAMFPFILQQQQQQAMFGRPMAPPPGHGLLPGSGGSFVRHPMAAAMHQQHLSVMAQQQQLSSVIGQGQRFGQPAEDGEVVGSGNLHHSPDSGTADGKPSVGGHFDPYSGLYRPPCIPPTFATNPHDALQMGSPQNSYRPSLGPQQPLQLGYQPMSGMHIGGPPPHPLFMAGIHPQDGSGYGQLRNLLQQQWTTGQAATHLQQQQHPNAFGLLHGASEHPTVPPPPSSSQLGEDFFLQQFGGYDTSPELHNSDVHNQGQSPHSDGVINYRCIPPPGAGGLLFHPSSGGTPSYHGTAPSESLGTDVASNLTQVSAAAQFFGRHQSQTLPVRFGGPQHIQNFFDLERARKITEMLEADPSGVMAQQLFSQDRRDDNFTADNITKMQRNLTVREYWPIF